LVVYIIYISLYFLILLNNLNLTLNLKTWRIFRAPNNAFEWQTGFNSALKVKTFYFFTIIFRVRIFTHNFLRYIALDTLEKLYPYNFSMCPPRSCHIQPTGTTFPEEMLANLKYLFCGKPGLFFRLLSPDKFHPILLLTEPSYDR